MFSVEVKSSFTNDESVVKMILTAPSSALNKLINISSFFVITMVIYSLTVEIKYQTQTYKVSLDFNQ